MATAVPVGMRTRDIAAVIRRLRGATLLRFDSLSDTDLEREALPDWTVADVFRHLADSDRGSVLGAHLLEFLPSKDLDEFEKQNDVNLERLRAVGRTQLRRELEVWGQRLARVIAATPNVLARRQVSLAFGRLPLAWMAGLRPYDEWVHNWDIAQAVDGPEAPEPAMEPALRDLLAWFQLRALPADALLQLGTRDGVVEVAVDGGPTWRFDLAAGTWGPDVAATPTARIELDVAAFCLLAAARVPWATLEAAGRIRVDDDEAGTAHAVLDAVRVV